MMQQGKNPQQKLSSENFRHLMVTLISTFPVDIEIKKFST